MSPLFLVDASIYVFRSYYSIPTSFFDAKGELVNAVYGYTGFLLDLLARKPAAVSVAFDESLTTCYRNRIYPDYKANRELPDANLQYQLQQCQRITGLLGFHNLSLVDYEADDIIGTLLTAFGKDRAVIIVTRDKDLGQLVRAGDTLWDFAADAYTDAQGVVDKFGVRPDQLADYLALAGDAVDNIPGVPGIGAKTAAALLNHFGSLDALLQRLDEVAEVPIRGAKKIAAVLVANQAAVELYRQLTVINCHVPMQVEEADLVISPASAEALQQFCDDMAFGNRLRQRLQEVAA